MKNISIGIMLICLPITFSAYAWNTGAHIVNWVQFERGGRIVFTLFDDGTSGESFQCNADGDTRLVIDACDSNTECMAAVNRMGSALLAAKVSGETVHVQNDNCSVTQVAVAN